ncbi:MAG: hypothetical protein K8T90_20895 [Planctomycetes bacterium]|nr:hypothetical protein [Planctomycetota bacterium]
MGRATVIVTRCRLWFALAAIALGAALLVTISRSKPQPEPFRLDETLPPGALVRIGSRKFGPVGGPNKALIGISPDGARLFTCDDDGELRAWDIDSAEGRWRVGAHTDTVAPSGAGVAKRLDMMWDVVWRGYHEPPRDLAVSPDGRRVATCAGAMIRVFDTDDGTCVAEHRTRNMVDAIAWSHDGRRIYRTDEDRLLAWDVDADEETQSAPLGSKYLSVTPRPDGSLAVVAEDRTGPGRIRRLDGTTLASLAPVVALPESWDGARLFDDRGRELVVQYPARTAPRVFHWGWFDPATGEVTPAIDTNGYVFAEVLSKPGRSFVVAGLASMDLVRLADGSKTRIASGSYAGSGIANGGRRIAFGAIGRSRIYDVEAGRRLHGDELIVAPRAFVVSADGRSIVAASDEASVVEIDTDSGRVLRRFDVGTIDDAEFVVSANGRFVGGRTWQGLFRIDLATGEVTTSNQSASQPTMRGDHVIGIGITVNGLAVLDATDDTATPLERGDGNYYSSATFSADGTRVTSGVEAGRFVWDTITGRIVDERPEPFRSLRLEVGARRRILTIRDVACADTPERTAVVTPQDALRIHGSAPHIVVQHDRLLALGAERDGEGVVVVLSADDGRTLATFPEDTGPARDAANRLGAVVRIQFTPDGTRIVSGHGDGTILVWDLDAALR